MAARGPATPQKVNRHLANARRLIIRSVERAAEVDLLPGHLAEMQRRLAAVREEADRAVEAFGKEAG